MTAPFKDNLLAFHFPNQQQQQFTHHEDDQGVEVGCHSSRGLLTRKQAVKESHMIKTKSDKDAKKDF
jgi:hypothetical protein